MNPEKLKQLQEQVRIGGKGSARRKKKVVHKSTVTDDKKIQMALKKVGVTNIPGIEEVNMIKDDGDVIHFNNPKVQASLASNTFAITGHCETKSVAELLPTILSHMRPDNLTSALKKMTNQETEGADGKSKLGVIEDDEVPDLVENFDEASMAEVD